MIPRRGKNRTGKPEAPDPELLAAYLDGEFEGRDGVDDLRRKVEGWLESDPAAQHLVRDYRRLRRGWSATSPPEPGKPVWETILGRVHRDLAASGRQPPRRSRMPWLIGLAAACIAALALMAFGPGRKPAAPSVSLAHGVSRSPLPEAGEEEGVLPVAQAHEIAILEVEEDDMSLVAVARPPLTEVIELVRPEDVTVSPMEPHSGDGTVTEVRVGTRSPMIWAYVARD